MNVDINKLYEVAEDTVHQITSSRPYAIDKELGLDSLDILEMTMEIEKFFGLSFPIEFHKSINSDMSLLEIVIYLHKEIEKDMDKLRLQATDYAKTQLNMHEERLILRNDVSHLIRQAYIQGWVDRDTRDMKPETQDEFLNGE